MSVPFLSSSSSFLVTPVFFFSSENGELPFADGKLSVFHHSMAGLGWREKRPQSQAGLLELQRHPLSRVDISYLLRAIAKL